MPLTAKRRQQRIDSGLLKSPFTLMVWKKPGNLKQGASALPGFCHHPPNLAQVMVTGYNELIQKMPIAGYSREAF